MVPVFFQILSRTQCAATARCDASAPLHKHTQPNSATLRTSFQRSLFGQQLWPSKSLSLSTFTQNCILSLNPLLTPATVYRLPPIPVLGSRLSYCKCRHSQQSLHPVQLPYTCFGRTTRTWKASCISPRPAKFKPTNTLCNLKPARVHQTNLTLMRRYACKFLPIEGRELPNIHELREYLCNT